jgi:LysM repeat protein
MISAAATTPAAVASADGVAGISADFATGTPAGSAGFQTAPVACSSPAQVMPATYTVKSGECLWRICHRVLGNPFQYRQVALTNNISRPDLIYPGQVLRFPQTPAVLEKPVLAPVVLKKTVVKIPAPAASLLDPDPAPPAVTFPNRPNACFGPGEQLSFSVEYFGISAGFATLSVLEGPKLHSRPTYHLLAEARTHPAFEWFYKVRDKIESYFDQQSLFPWRYEKHLREGGYSNDSDMSYDQAQQRVIKDQGRTIVSAPPLTQDVLSEFYYFRTLPLKVGDDIKIPVVADDGKIYDLRVNVLRRERITVPAGTFNCLMVEPYLNFEGLFQHKGKLHIWVTDDVRRVPVLIKSEILIGSINIVLRNAVVVEP